MNAMKSPFVRWSAGAIVVVAVLAVLHERPWQPRAAATPGSSADGGGPETLKVG